mgnify:CR=1 FL=1
MKVLKDMTLMESSPRIIKIFSLFQMYNYSDAVWINLWNETWHFFGISRKVHVPEYVIVLHLWQKSQNLHIL